MLNSLISVITFTYFLFDHFLEARAEICNKFRWFFGEFEDKKKIF